ncbi:MAG: DUF2341 domain-containing protein [Fibrobacter sp.]|nr:DUF2341 domain-containing protein [Fibrobacter sp.]
MNNILKVFLTFALSTLLAGCTEISPLAGGGLDTESSGGKLTGKVVLQGGKPGSFSQIDLIPQSYTPFSAHTISTVSADSSGSYSFNDVDSGTYNIEAFDPSSGKRLLHLDIKIEQSDSIDLYSDTLKAPSGIIVPGNLIPGDGILYITGTKVSLPVVSGAAFITIDSVPSGTLPPLLFTASEDDSPSKLSDSIFTEPDIYFIADSLNSWEYSKQIFLNSNAINSVLNDPVADVPLLVRFTSSNFNFSETESGGEDIRFFDAWGKPLKFELERWDLQSSLGEAWIRFDTLSPSSQFIFMRWGNKGAQSGSEPSMVFDTASGFRGVWHLTGESDGVRNHGLYKDATFNRNNGDDYIRARGLEGVNGPGHQFNGTNDYILIPGHDAYNFGTGPFTISLWFKVTEQKRNDLFIYKFDSENGKMGISSGPDGTLFFWASAAGVTDTVCRSSPLGSDKWYSVSLVRGKDLTAKLYVNGELTNDRSFTADVTGSSESSCIILGSDLSPDSTVINSLGGFLDEVRIGSEERTQEWVEINYLNQRTDGTLIEAR